MKIRKFNEGNGGDFGGTNVNPHYKPIKRFVLTTTSESSDHYIYFIEHTEIPTREELNRFLVENGNDVEDGYSYEGIDKCVEIKDFKRL